jgi:FKBP-type peptidyl-prolyl cis-trans isomerase
MQRVIDDVFIDTLTFKIGYSKQMRGLNYAIKLLKVGDKAKIIIPSYLGFGLSGYKQSVPPYSTLLLNIKLLNIEK